MKDVGDCLTHLPGTCLPSWPLQWAPPAPSAQLAPPLPVTCPLVPAARPPRKALVTAAALLTLSLPTWKGL